MTDVSELKRLAQRVIDIEACEGGVPIGEAWDEFEAVATPSVVLSLIADNERLTADEQEATDLCDRLSDLLRSTTIEVRGPEEPLKRHGFADLPSRVKTVVAERDQLKAESAGLKTGYEAYEQTVKELRGDVEALREALTSTREFLMHDAKVRRMTDGVRHISPMFPLRKLVMEQIDAALGKGEQS
jgi:chromosome segregation ATPase